jgi:copper(I)-binding protein
MKTTTTTFAALAFATGLAATTLPAMADDMKVENPRARPSLGVAKNTAAFFTIYNNTDKDDKLLRAEGDVARKVELHTHLKVDGVFKMRPVKFIAIPAHGKAVLQSGGLHVMVIGVHNKLRVGDSFKLKLNFEHAAPVSITVPVKMLKGHMKMDHKKMHGMKKKMPAD